MATREILIAGYRHLETLGNCMGYYSCPKDANGKRLGPLVGYAGTYEAQDGSQRQFVGDVYANFAKAEMHPNVLKYFATCLINRFSKQIDFANVDVFCGAPIGGYSLTDALGLQCNIRMVKAEKKVTALKTETSREKSELVFARHDIRWGDVCVIVEDVCNNFSTTEKFVELIYSRGGSVLGIACFLNRSLTVDRVFEMSLSTGVCVPLPVVSLVRMPIYEWKQDDPEVADDVARDNVVWKPKDDWNRLMLAMQDAG